MDYCLQKLNVRNQSKIPTCSPHVGKRYIKVFMKLSRRKLLYSWMKCNCLLWYCGFHYTIYLAWLHWHLFLFLLKYQDQIKESLNFRLTIFQRFYWKKKKKKQWVVLQAKIVLYTLIALNYFINSFETVKFWAVSVYIFWNTTGIRLEYYSSPSNYGNAFVLELPVFYVTCINLTLMLYVIYM